MMQIMNDETDIIHSPLEQTFSAEGHRVHIHIYRSMHSQWVLEVVDESGVSTVWDDLFETDTQALAEALMAIQSEGLANFIDSADALAYGSAPNLIKAVKPNTFEPSAQEVQDMTTPLSEEELDELDNFLLYGVDDDEGMTLEALDGYLHAIAIGPQTIMPSQWLPKVWGEGSTQLPPTGDLDQCNRIMALVMRHYNSVISGFQHKPPVTAPYWSIHHYDDGEFEDAEVWAYGFSEGVALQRDAWQPLFDSPEGRQWYRPIGLLGEDHFSADQDALTTTPAQREQLAMQIEDSLLNIHAFWLPLREATYEREMSKHLRTKVGRNEPCPCGSGKKFKKCCGFASELH